MSLPAVHAIGFTGDTHIADEAACRSAIDRLLAERQAVAGRIVYGVSSLSPGSPSIFAESCLAARIPLRLLLPDAPDQLLSQCSAQEMPRFQRAMDAALSIEIAATEGSAEDRAYECGLQIARQCQELFVYTTAQLGQGLAGPGEIAAFAAQIRCRIVHIDGQSAARHAPVPPERTPPERELDFLNELPSPATKALAREPTVLARAWLAKLDANAAHLAPQVRRLAALPIVCTALAAFATSAAPGRRASGLWVAAGAVFGGSATVLPVLLRLGRRQALWVRIRTAAEVSRSILAVWGTPGRYRVVGPEVLPELNDMVRSLDILRSQAGQTSHIGIDEFKQQYIEGRLLDQTRYFSLQSAHSAAMGRRYRLVGKLCVAIAVLLSAWMFSSRTLLRVSTSASGGTWLPLVASALFQIATIVGALLVVNECERRERRYQEIHRSLAEWEIELRAFHTWPPVIEVVSKIERALLVELLEWRSLLQNMKMPKN